MLSSPLGQHVLNYEPPRRFVIPAFTMFDGSNDPYMLHYNQGTKFPKLQPKYRLLVEIDKIYPPKNRLYQILAIFPHFSCFFGEISLFFPSFQKSGKKNASKEIRTHPKCLEVTPSSNQAIDCTYYI